MTTWRISGQNLEIKAASSSQNLDHLQGCHICSEVMGDGSVHLQQRTNGQCRVQAAKEVRDDLGVLDLGFHNKVSATAYDRARCSLQHVNPVLALRPAG
jgi:hypothetical protein